MPWSHLYQKALVHPVGDVSHTSWVEGKPIAILNHFTVTCGATWPGAGRFGTEGIGSPFGIRRDGTVCQYVDADEATWHAFDMSKYAVGIEFDASPSTGCPITEAQLGAGAELNAWLCKTFGIPPYRAAGVAYSAGIKCHTDGLEDGGKAWDHNGHYDAPWQAAGDPIGKWCSLSEAKVLNTSPWTSAQFCSRVAELVNPPPPPPPPNPPGGPVTDADAKQLGFATIKDWRTQEERSKAVADVLAGREKRTGQDPAYGEQYDATKAKVG